MAIKEYTFKVDFITKNSLCMADVNQEDNAIFNIYLTKKGEAVDLNNQQIRIFVRKPDGKLVVQENNIEVVDAKGGAIRVNANNSMFQAVGVAVGQVDLWGADGHNISSSPFLMEVGEHLGGNAVVESYVDVALFRQLTEYIAEANADILKYKTLFESFVKAGVSLEGLNDIKAYIDNNLAELKSETDEAVSLIPRVDKARTDAEAKRVEVVDTTARAESKRVELVNTTNSAEAKRVELVNTTNTANASKTALEGATAKADTKKKEVESATANAEVKRKEVVAVTNTANTSKGQLETATANADKKKAEVVSVTADAEKKRAEVVGTTNTANETKKALDGSIASGQSVKSGLDGSISSGNNLKAGLDSSITSGNATKSALDSATSSANTKKGEVITATNNAESKKVELVAVTNSAEAKRKELQDAINSVGTAGFVRKAGDTMTGTLTLTKADSLLAFQTERGWKFKQGGSGSETSLDLVSDTDGKAFKILEPTGKKGVTMWVSSGGTQLNVDGHLVYHQGFKPSPAELGALGKTEQASDSAKLQGFGTYRGTGGAGIPLVDNNGVMEVGKYIDFHIGGDADYNLRLEAQQDMLKVLGSTSVNDSWIRKYLHIADWYGKNDNAQFWYKAENQTLYLENVNDFMINNSKVFVEPQKTPLWSGCLHVTGTQNITPSKPLSRCRTGWVLVWSRFDANTGAMQNESFSCTYVPKNAYAEFPLENDHIVTRTAFDPPIIKALRISDSYFTGYESNGSSPKNGVALRYVYEF